MSSSFSLVTGKVTRGTLLDPDGNNIKMKLQDWSWKYDIKEIPNTGLDAVREINEAVEGASGSFTIALSTADVYNFFQARAQEYAANGSYRYSSFIGYIDYLDGTQSVMTFKNVSLTLEESSFKVDDVVKFKVMFKAQSVTF